MWLYEMMGCQTVCGGHILGAGDDFGVSDLSQQK